jgi:non-heme chloroperoxidase
LSVKAFSETDLSEDRRRFDVPTLVIHGDDQVVPIAAVGRASAAIVKDAILTMYPARRTASPT